MTDVGSLQQGKVEQMFDTSVPRIAGNIFELMRSIPQECVPKRIGEQPVDVVVPQIDEQVVDVPAAVSGGYRRVAAAQLAGLYLRLHR